MIYVESSIVDSLGYDIDTELAAYTAAMAAHASTVNVPAPTTYPLISEIYRDGGQYTVIYPDPVTPPPEPTPPTFEEMVNNERGRRTSLPLEVTLPGPGTFTIDLAGRGRQNISDLAVLAQHRLSIGSIAPFTIRDVDDINHNLSPNGMMQLATSVVQHITAVYEASWALKAMDPQPEDIENDIYWP